MTRQSPDRKKIHLGTRASKLALWQANWVKSTVEAQNPGTEVSLVHIRTEGDRIDFPLFKVGGKGLFVKEIEEALLRGEIDLAVHSAKDLPALIPEGLALLAFPEREDPRDILILRAGKSWRDLPAGGKVGTSSLRRQAQLLHLRPDLSIIPLRGNLDTRIRKLTDLHLDGVVLASAGMRRMGWEGQVTEYLEPEIMLPAIGQGVLAIEGRQDDEAVHRILASLDHPPTRAALIAERAFMKKLEGGCQVPMAGLARLESGGLTLWGLVAGVNGRNIVKGKMEGPMDRGEEIGETLAEELLGRGAREILDEVYKQ